MKKIIISTNSLGGGGAEKVLLNIVKNISKKKYLIDIFLLSNKGIYKEEIGRFINKIEGLEPRNLKYDKVFILKKLNSLFQKIKFKFLLKGYYKKNKKSYDLEISFLEGPSAEYISKRKSFSKKIAWIHTDLEKHRTMSMQKEKKIYKTFDKIICVSHASKESFLNLYPEYKEKVKVIHNAIDKEEIASKSKEKISDLRKDKINIITVGRLINVKGYDLLLQAHKELLEEGLDYNLVILGEGELKKSFQKYVIEKNISLNTQILGFKSNPYPYIKKADIFIMTSRYEGYPLVLCEAIILGKPIISTDCAGPTEILENGKYGILIPTENIEALKNSIRQMVKNLDLRKKYSSLAKERSRMFDIDIIIKQIEDLFDEK